MPHRLFLVVALLSSLPTASALAEAQPAAVVSFTLGQPANVSLAVYDEAGLQVRVLLRAEPLEAGEHEASWDGLDDNGKPVAAGTYTWRLARHGGIQAEYLLSLGTSVAHRHWPGQHGGPHGVEVHDGQLYLSSSMSEGAPQAVKVELKAHLSDPEAKGYHWGMPTLAGWHRGVDIAVAADRVWFISGHHRGETKNNYLYIRDAATGTHVAELGIMTLPIAPPADATEQQAAIETVQIDRVDATDRHVVVASGKGVLAGLDPVSGEQRWHRQVSGGIRDIAVTPAGDVLVLYADRLLRLPSPAADAAPKTLTTELAAAARLDVDPATGEIFIAQHGDSQQVVKLAAGGQLLAAYGRKGGRQLGRYIPSDFLDPTDIAADEDGGFVVTENSPPRRTAHFDADGQLLREWYGGQQFYTYASPDPADPSQVWMDTQWGYLMHVEVDYDVRTWHVRAIYHWPADFDGDGDVDRFDTFYMGKNKMARHHDAIRRDLDGDGEKELYITAAVNGGFLAKPDEAAGVFRPLALYSAILAEKGWNWRDAGAEAYPEPYLEALAARGITPETDWDKRRFHNNFTWADADGDHAVDVEEIRIHYIGGHGGNPGVGSALMLDHDLNTLVGSSNAWRTVPAIERTPGGAPIWAPEKAEPAAEAYRVGNVMGLAGSTGGTLYAIAHTDGGDGYWIGGVHSKGHGYNWPGTQIAGTGLFAWDDDQRLLWRDGRHATRAGNLQLPGTLHFPVRVFGPIAGAIGVADKIVNPCELWTTDGLYLGGIFDGRVDDGLPNRVYAWWRGDIGKTDAFDNLALHQYDMALGGSLFERPNGDVIWFGAGWNNVPVYRIHGLDVVQREQGQVRIETAAPAPLREGTGLRATYVAGTTLEGEPLLTIIDPQVWFGRYSMGNRQMAHWPRLGEGADPAMHGKAADAETPKGEPLPATFTVHWSGWLEPLYTEAYTFSTYDQPASLRIDGQDIALKQQGFGSKYYSQPIRLQSGKRVPIELIWLAKEGPQSEAHLNWQSPSQQIEHIPQSALYPQMED